MGQKTSEPTPPTAGQECRYCGDGGHTQHGYQMGWACIAVYACRDRCSKQLKAAWKEAATWGDRSRTAEAERDTFEGFAIELGVMVWDYWAGEAPTEKRCADAQAIIGGLNMPSHEMRRGK